TNIYISKRSEISAKLLAPERAVLIGYGHSQFWYRRRTHTMEFKDFFFAPLTQLLEGCNAGAFQGSSGRSCQNSQKALRRPSILFANRARRTITAPIEDMTLSTNLFNTLCHLVEDRLKKFYSKPHYSKPQ